MRIYHQMGHNFVWNIESLKDDGVGDGHIVSPVNITAEKIADRISQQVIANSFWDPQFYLPDDSKSKLETYPFFPNNVLDEFSTYDFEQEADEIAARCLEFQHHLGFRYGVIPTRYYNDLPESYLDDLSSVIVEPFISAHKAIDNAAPLLLTVIAKPFHLEEGPRRTELLTWATNYPQVDGIYLIFDNDFRTKRIKEPDHLAGQMLMIHDLRYNDLEVHVGYMDVEGLLLSIADPTSVTVGSYENLRSFETRRLETREPSPQQGPRPRVYSGRLLQWIEDTYLPPIRKLVPNWRQLFDDSPYVDYLVNPNTALNFQRKEIYKHYFSVFARQVEALPSDISDRPDYVRDLVQNALELFDVIADHGVFLDSDSDRSHLPAWMNAISMYENSI